MSIPLGILENNWYCYTFSLCLLTFARNWKNAVEIFAVVLQSLHQWHCCSRRCCCRGNQAVQRLRRHCGVLRGDEGAAPSRSRPCCVTVGTGEETPLMWPRPACSDSSAAEPPGTPISLLALLLSNKEPCLSAEVCSAPGLPRARCWLAPLCLAPRLPLRAATSLCRFCGPPGRLAGAHRRTLLLSATARCLSSANPFHKGRGRAFFNFFLPLYLVSKLQHYFLVFFALYHCVPKQLPQLLRFDFTKN
ncbi:uncharacterized protein [Taeniopygia guttata]|uniref:uncharacterized protein n=1 Tax=Taeniopygia guttata TaxID=59729 RepID=UPI003BB8F4D2